MKIVKMDVQVCVPDCVTGPSILDAVSTALFGCVGVHAVEVGLQGGGDGVSVPDVLGALRPAMDEAKPVDAAPAKRRRRRVNANGEKCEVVDNGDGTVTETRR